MESHFPWNNNSGMRQIVDMWSDSQFSYALIIHVDNVLHLQWTTIYK